VPRFGRAVVAVLTAAALTPLIGAPAGLAATGIGWWFVAAPGAGQGWTLRGVAATPAGEAWAVGYRGPGGHETLAEHWDGSDWSVTSSLDPSTDGNELHGVDAVDSTHVWAVGTKVGMSGFEPLIEFWNGSDWSEQAAIGDGQLHAVAALSATDAWAVGTTEAGGTLIERWNGSTWSQVTGADPSTNDVLLGVAAVSGTDAWAVGRSDAGTLLERWNGSTWSAVASPAGVALMGIAAFAPDDVWAVGATATDPIALHWDGMAWTDADPPAPTPGETSLAAVSGSGTDDAWAVGTWDPIANQTFIEHWDGDAWSIVPSPNPATVTSTSLAGVAAASSTDAWAVGVDGYDGDALIARHAEGMFTSTVKLGDPAPIMLGDPSNLTGTLTFSGNASSAGETVQVSRTNPDASITDLGDVAVGFTGFDVPDTPAVRGTYRYTASFAGDGTFPAATDSATLTVRGHPSQISIAATRHHLVIGGGVVLTAQLSLHEAGRMVALQRHLPGGVWSPIAKGPVDADGRFAVHLVPTTNARYRARFAGDDLYAPAISGQLSITVAAVVMIRPLGGYATKAGYRLYHFSQPCAARPHRGCPVIAVSVRPSRPGARIRFDLATFLHGAWRAAGSTSGRLGRASTAGVLFFYDDGSVIGRPFRLRAAFGDARNAGALSPWVTFKITS
jgi:hypothetical protein